MEDAMDTQTRARCEIGSACSNAFVFDDAGRNRHAAISIHSDGSGSISIYDSKRQRLLANISLEEGGAMTRQPKPGPWQEMQYWP